MTETDRYQMIYDMAFVAAHERLKAETGNYYLSRYPAFLPREANLAAKAVVEAYVVANPENTIARDLG